METVRAWVGETPTGVVIARSSEGGGLVVDRPALGRFREPMAVAPFTPWLRFTARPIHPIEESAAIAGEGIAFRATIG